MISSLLSSIFCRHIYSGSSAGKLAMVSATEANSWFGSREPTMSAVCAECTAHSGWCGVQLGKLRQPPEIHCRRSLKNEHRDRVENRWARRMDFLFSGGLEWESHRGDSVTVTKILLCGILNVCICV